MYSVLKMDHAEFPMLKIISTGGILCTVIFMSTVPLHICVYTYNISLCIFDDMCSLWNNFTMFDYL